MNTLHSLVKSVLVVEIIFATSVHSSQNKNNMNNIFSDDMSYCGALIERNACLDNSLSDINSISDDDNKYSKQSYEEHNNSKQTINSNEINDEDEKSLCRFDSDEEVEEGDKSCDINDGISIDFNNNTNDENNCNIDDDNNINDNNKENSKYENLHITLDNNKIDEQINLCKPTVISEESHFNNNNIKNNKQSEKIKIKNEILEQNKKQSESNCINNGHNNVNIEIIEKINEKIENINLELDEINEYKCELLLDKYSLNKQLKDKQLEKKKLEERMQNIQLEIINLLTQLNDVKASEENSDKQPSSCNKTDSLWQIISEMELKIINLLNMFLDNKMNNKISVKDEFENNLKSKISDKNNLSNQIRNKSFEIGELEIQIENNESENENLNELKKNKMRDKKNLENQLKNIIDNQLKNKKIDIYANLESYSDTENEESESCDKYSIV